MQREKLEQIEILKKTYCGELFSDFEKEKTNNKENNSVEDKEDL